jgi:hypothetical protein
MWVYILLILIIAGIIWFAYNKKYEHFNEQTGQLCLDCNGKNFGQCLQCFNCTFLWDRYGNGYCTGGDQKSGPYNNEDYVVAYYTDVFPQQKYDNAHYKCSYGPPQENRIIGI